MELICQALFPNYEGTGKASVFQANQDKKIHLIDTFKALKLMESEGSGYDLIYEKLSLDGKLYPQIENDINFVKVTIY